MKFFILKMQVNGIKSIDKEVTFNFCNSTLSKQPDFSDSHVKAIYGPNGAGKTGLIYAADIYYNLVFDEKYITISNYNESLKNLINQKTGEFKVRFIFANLKDNGTLDAIFSHHFVLKKVSGEYIIAEEKFSKLSGYNVNAEEKYSTIFHVRDGEVIETFRGYKHIDDLKKATMNLLTKSSLLSAIATRPPAEGITFGVTLLNYLQYLISFIENITIVLQESDTNFINFLRIKKQLDLITQSREKIDKEIFNELLYYNRFVNTDKCVRRISKDRFVSYQSEVDNLCSFIKVFKDDLETIEIKREENGEYYECENILIYKDNRRISEKFESTGIKKLIEIYSALCDLEKGKIVFIDEFDANIHDVLLVKIVEYVMEYSCGQFVFTTHNLGPMEELENGKHSIDFLSSDSRVESWKSNGNYSAAAQYSKGYVKYSPFNIEAFNFIGVFGEGRAVEDDKDDLEITEADSGEEDK